MMTRNISIAKWEEIRSLTQSLYQRGNVTLDDLISHLQDLQYDVDHRMLRRKISDWGYYKKLREVEVLTAIELWTPYRCFYELGDISFYIRDRLVTGHELTLYLKRKGINNPFEWAQQHTQTSLQRCVHVALGPVLATGEAVQVAIDHSRPRSDASASESDMIPSGIQYDTSSDQMLNRHQSWNNFQLDSSRHHFFLTLYNLQDPDQHYHVIQAMNYAQNFCLQYLDTERPDARTEPTVHAMTNHGRFGDRMAHGLFQLSHQELQAAFVSFNEACLLLEISSYAEDPVPLALVLDTLCKVSARGYEDLARIVLLHATRVTCNNGSPPESLQGLLYAISRSPNIAYCAKQILQAMSIVQSTQDHLKWRNLYIRERLCDSLSHCGEHGSLTFMRLKLLHDQSAFYGPDRRNVLYTLTKVADNHLGSGNLVWAEQGFQAAFERAQSLSGYGKAKTEFVALEGLAKTRQARAQDLIRQACTNKTDRLALVKDAKWHLTLSMEYATSARDTARSWFDADSRRTVRAEELQHELVGQIGNITI